MAEAADIFSIMPEAPDIFSAYLNTGTLYDLACGKVLPCGKNYIVNGGVSNIIGVVGKSQTYKSTISDSFLSRILSIYPGVKALIFDSENNKVDITRYDDFAINGAKVSDNIRLLDTTTDDLNSIHNKIKDIVAFKKKHAKSMMIETPFLDVCGKPIMMLMPTIVYIDSFTMAQVDSTSESIESVNLDDSALNTIWMRSGKNKTLFMRQLVQYARSANIYFMLTAHMGELKDIGGNAYNQPQKQLQYFGQKDRLKDVGAQFEFLTNTLLKMNGASVLQNKTDRSCLYPAEFSSATELCTVTATVARNKINASGLAIPFVVSQFEGLLHDVTNLNYLKEQKAEDLLIQKVGNMNLAMMPNTTFTRNNVREKVKENYELSRALDLSAQLVFIKNCWSSYNLPVDLSISTDKFIDNLMTGTTPMISDVLNSRSYWTYNKEDKRPLLTIFDILEMMATGKKPAPSAKPVLNTKAPIVAKAA